MTDYKQLTLNDILSIHDSCTCGNPLYLSIRRSEIENSNSYAHVSFYHSLYKKYLTIGNLDKDHKLEIRIENKQKDLGKERERYLILDCTTNIIAVPDSFYTKYENEFSKNAYGSSNVNVIDNYSVENLQLNMLFSISCDNPSCDDFFITGKFQIDIVSGRINLFNRSTTLKLYYYKNLINFIFYNGKIDSVFMVPQKNEKNVINLSDKIWEYFLSNSYTDFSNKIKTYHTFS